MSWLGRSIGGWLGGWLGTDSAAEDIGQPSSDSSSTYPSAATVLRRITSLLRAPKAHSETASTSIANTVSAIKLSSYVTIQTIDGAMSATVSSGNAESAPVTATASNGHISSDITGQKPSS